ncbi:MAG: hypothetical protein ACK52I_23375 [Pseudomonadota bacterium]
MGQTENSLDRSGDSRKAGVGRAHTDHILEQFALELLIGAHENSDWLNGKLVIDANHGPIHLLQAAFYAVKLEVQRRNHRKTTPGRQ